eukprot:gene1913-469_t
MPFLELGGVVKLRPPRRVLAQRLVLPHTSLHDVTTTTLPFMARAASPRGPRGLGQSACNGGEAPEPGPRAVPSPRPFMCPSPGACPQGSPAPPSDCDSVCGRACALAATCTAPGVCDCPDGYAGTGDACEGCSAICDPICGWPMLCAQPGLCLCPAGWAPDGDQPTACTALCGGVTGGACAPLAECVLPDLCECPAGWIGDGELLGQGCVPDCRTVTGGGGCHPAATCTSAGECTCPPDLVGDGELGGSGCAAGCNPSCHPDATCIDNTACVCLPALIYVTVGDGTGPGGCDRVCPDPGANIGCDINGKCVGQDQCECLPGYSGDGRQDGTGCTAQCEVRTCHAQALCGPPRVCTCKDGWQGDGFATGSGCQAVCHIPCVDGATCMAPGLCVCPMGTVGDALIGGSGCRAAICPDPDGCSANALCTADGVCECNPGFMGDGLVCSLACGDTKCHQLAECIDGACLCANGLHGDGVTICAPFCEVPCSVLADCILPNTCECLPGYVGNGIHCTCGCAEHADCVPGGGCACVSGYFGDGTTGGTGCTPSCADVLGGGCSADASCTASFTCSCRPGLFGDGEIGAVGCLQQPTCSPPCHSQATCVDINVCTCNTGYFGDGLLQCSAVCDPACVDNMECLLPQTCSCIPGYYMDMLECMPDCSTAPGGGCVDDATCAGPGECQCSVSLLGDGAAGGTGCYEMVMCGPPDIPHADFRGCSGMSNGMECALLCDAGFEPSQPFIRCLQGEWPTSAMCTASSCSVPPTIPNSNNLSNCADAPHQGQCNVACASGYVISGSPSLTCAYGQWVPYSACIPCTPVCTSTPLIGAQCTNLPDGCGGVCPPAQCAASLDICDTATGVCSAAVCLSACPSTAVPLGDTCWLEDDGCGSTCLPASCTDPLASCDLTGSGTCKILPPCQACPSQPADDFSECIFNGCSGPCPAVACANPSSICDVGQTNLCVPPYELCRAMPCPTGASGPGEICAGVNDGCGGHCQQLPCDSVDHVCEVGLSNTCVLRSTFANNVCQSDCSISSVEDGVRCNQISDGTVLYAIFLFPGDVLNPNVILSALFGYCHALVSSAVNLVMVVEVSVLSAQRVLFQTDNTATRHCLNLHMPVWMRFGPAQPYVSRSVQAVLFQMVVVDIAVFYPVLVLATVTSQPPIHVLTPPVPLGAQMSLRQMQRWVKFAQALRTVDVVAFVLLLAAPQAVNATLVGMKHVLLWIVSLHVGKILLLLVVHAHPSLTIAGICPQPSCDVLTLVQLYMAALSILCVAIRCILDLQTLVCTVTVVTGVYVLPVHVFFHMSALVDTSANVFPGEQRCADIPDQCGGICPPTQCIEPGFACDTELTKRCSPSCLEGSALSDCKACGTNGLCIECNSGASLLNNECQPDDDPVALPPTDDSCSGMAAGLCLILCVIAGCLYTRNGGNIFVRTSDPWPPSVELTTPFVPGAMPQPAVNFTDGWDSSSSREGDSADSVGDLWVEEDQRANLKSALKSLPGAGI